MKEADCVNKFDQKGKNISDHGENRIHAPLNASVTTACTTIVLTPKRYT